MPNQTSNAQTEQKFKSNPNRASTEIFDLVPILNEISGSEAPITQEQADLLDALARQARNARFPLTNGLEALGVTMAAAADNENYGILTNDVVGALGWMIQAMAQQIEKLTDIADAAQYQLGNRVVGGAK